MAEFALFRYGGTNWRVVTVDGNPPAEPSTAVFSNLDFGRRMRVYEDADHGEETFYTVDSTRDTNFTHRIVEATEV